MLPPPQGLSFAGSHQPSDAHRPSSHLQGAVCISNIGPKERRRRLAFGVVTLTLSAGIAAVLVATRVPAWWRLLLFLPLAAGASGVFQWREKT